jgi:hypothetical protein
VVSPLAPEVPSRQPVQLDTNHRHKLITGGLVASPPTSQQSRDLASLVMHPRTGALKRNHNRKLLSQR